MITTGEDHTMRLRSLALAACAIALLTAAAPAAAAAQPSECSQFSVLTIPLLEDCQAGLPDQMGVK
ncbi:hypothetical protein SSP35_08_01460 [Streptomyces sp. NBRC 110611]|uniref:hypothetical protein n=1 Tax=Streptomyces sp. NBRC 110611 TaxID=1621259 RepID=UPI000829D6C4|nr:hypothetical protein [Streptomyces sp. NBRC 110611]GAU68652.1 hypothetical protein SSP35_08_01460 [Streptomyces sp. NBRC 110611]